MSWWETRSAVHTSDPDPEEIDNDVESSIGWCSNPTCKKWGTVYKNKSGSNWYCEDCFGLGT